jgi:hypothetical protein
MNAQEIQSQAMGEMGKQLAAGKWRPLVESIQDKGARELTAVLLENESRYIANMEEDVKISSIGSFEKFVFPIVRAVFPNLIAKDIVSVQPMTGPTSLVFYLDAVYGSSKGTVTAGDTMFSARKGHLADDQYSSEAVTGETLVTAADAGGNTVIPASTLDYGSARPGTVVMSGQVTGTEAVWTARDNGIGGFIFTGNTAPVTAPTINYATGAISTFTLGTAQLAATAITVSYYYNSEGSANIPIVDINLSSVPVRAIPHKLRARWSVEAATNLKAVHGMDAESELVALLSEKIRWDVDRRVISDLFTIASAGSVTWNKPAPAAVSYNDHKQTFIDALIEASNLIFRATRRGTGNFVVCGTNVANVVESLYGFRPQAVAGNGVVFIGTLQGRWSIYKDPYLDADTFLVGWKGSSFLEAGYVFAPYVPLYTTPTYVLDDMLNRKGMMSQYGVKAINGDFYATGSITYTTV